MINLSTDKIYEILNLGTPIFHNINILGVSTDTRTIIQGNLYIPLVGETFNGHDFISKAFETGAVVSLCNYLEFEKRKDELSLFKDKLIFVEDAKSSYMELMSYWKKQFPNLITFGIGGTVGKTTTKELLRYICAAAGDTVFTTANNNTPLGMCYAVENIDENTKYLVCEMGTDSFGEISQEAKIVNPDFGVCLNVGPTHAEILGGNVDGVAKAESELVQYFSDKGTIILNIDNSFVSKMRSLVTTGKVLTMSKTQADVFVDSYEFTDEGLFLNLNTIKNVFISKLYGDGNVYNAMAAVTLAKLSGISDQTIKEGLKKYKPEKGRLSIFKIHDNITIQDDAYNANLDSMIQSINVCKNLSKDKYKIYVLGDMLELGIHADECHQKLGEFIKENLPNVLIYVGDFGEKIKSILKDTGLEIYLFPKIKDESLIDTVREKLNSLLKPNSWVLMKGSKGTGVWKVVEKLKD